jgi:hypothetical protein
MGLGTAGVESFSSFVRRFAAVQVRSVSELLHTDVLVPLRTERGDRHVRLAPTRATESVNGAGVGNQQIVARVASLANAPVDLLWPTTVLRLSSAIECRAAFRTTRAWCPACLEANGQAAYDRLRWSLAMVDACSEHGVGLVDVCMRCRQSHRPWHARANPLGCPHCGFALSASRSEPRDVNATSAAVESLIAWVEGANELNRRAVAGGFSALAQASGGLDGLARRIGSSKSGLSSVAGGLTRPHLSTFVKVLVLSNEELAVFLSHPAPARVNQHHGPRPPPIPRRSPALGALRREVFRPEPRSLRAFAQAHGTTPATLRRAAPELCSTLVTRRQTLSSAGRTASEAAVAVRVRTALLTLRGAGSEPTRREIEAFLGQPGLFRAPTARAALRPSQGIYLGKSITPEVE